MKRLEQRLLDDLLDAGYRAPRRHSHRRLRPSVAFVVAALLITATAAGGTLAFWDGGEGDKPTGPVEAVQPDFRIGEASVAIDAYQAADGLCFRVRESTTRDSSIACANVSAPPYAGLRPLGVLLQQQRVRGTLVVGLAPRSADHATVETGHKPIEVPTHLLPDSVSGTDRLSYFAATIAGDSHVDRITATQDGAVIADVTNPVDAPDPGAVPGHGSSRVP